MKRVAALALALLSFAGCGAGKLAFTESSVLVTTESAITQTRWAATEAEPTTQTKTAAQKPAATSAAATAAQAVYAPDSPPGRIAQLLRLAPQLTCVKVINYDSLSQGGSPGGPYESNAPGDIAAWVEFYRAMRLREFTPQERPTSIVRCMHMLSVTFYAGDDALDMGKILHVQDQLRHEFTYALDGFAIENWTLLPTHEPLAALFPLR
jgi:hypothetical protein